MPRSDRFRGLTPAQERVFELIAIGQSPYPCAERTLIALLDKELIKRTEMAESHPLGVFVRYVYEVPIPVHAEWCGWCEAQLT